MAKQELADFDKTYAALKKLITANRAGTKVVVDRPGYYCTASTRLEFNGQPAWFAGVRKGKAYVSYYLMPLYVCPELNDGLSPELKKRRQGKSCFNFTAPYPKLLRELAKLTRAGASAYRKRGSR